MYVAMLDCIMCYINIILCVDITVSPVYLRSHSGTVLMKAIQTDTEFLSHNNVMDYSMLTGIDENNQELVLGIIGLHYLHVNFFLLSLSYILFDNWKFM